MITPYDLSCEYSINPIGIDVRNPRLSWKSESPRRGARQSAYQIVVDCNQEKLPISAQHEIMDELGWNSGRIETDQSIHVVAGIEKPSPGTRYYWSVRVWDETGESSEWSKPGFWETGLLDHTGWQAEWITPEKETKIDSPQPPPLFRRQFTSPGDIESARLYVTALGVYEMRINGQTVGDAVLSPGWTSYDTRIQYQAYDVTGYLRDGENLIGATVGDGWFRGYLGMEGQRNMYGEKTALLAQLTITCRDGSNKTIITDSEWKTSTGAILMADLYMGERYDARLKKSGWDLPGYNDEGWDATKAIDHPKERVVAQAGPAVKRQERITPVEIITSPKGETIYDFGQNMVGRCRIAVKAEEGTEINLRHAEVLDQEGNLYTDNLRAAKQTVTYICAGTGEVEEYEPHFTFQGFRYVSIEGLPETPTKEILTGIVLHSEMATTGSFECSNTIINQLQHNILWGQKGNYLDVPTDCPQRDERLGWTGDAQVFIRTASFNMNVAGFFTKWLKDLSAEQRDNGSVPFVAPDVLARSNSPTFGTAGGAGSSAWGDAAVICPWTIYLCYGDTRLLEEQYGSMTAWVNFMDQEANERHIWDSGFHFGDWLDYRGMADLVPAPVTNNELIATAFFAYSAKLVSRAASVLDKNEDARKYAKLSEDVAKAFCDEFVTAEGRIGPNTQTAYVLALYFDLLPDTLRALAADRLAKEVVKAGYHLTTGFVGAPYLCNSLSRHGHVDLAYELLNQETYPSWLYPVNKGATTIWERWDGIKPDGSFQDVGMNSFNHYAYGAIGEWLYSFVAGLDVDQAEPGYKHVYIRPVPGGGLTHATAALESPYGPIESSWKLTDTSFLLHVLLPPNTRGTVSVPADTLESVTADGNPVAVGNGITDIVLEDGHAIIDVGAGTYDFASNALNIDAMMATVKHVAGQLDVFSTLRALIENPDAKSVLAEHLGDALPAAAGIGQALDIPLFRLSQFAPHILTEEKMEKINMELKGL